MLGKYCSCNRAHAVCKRCVCVQEGTRVSCLPSRAGNCSNVASQVPNKRTRSSSTAQHSPDVHDSSTAPNSPTDAISSSLPFERPRRRIIKRIPRASRELAAKIFASLLDTVVANNDSTSWSRLLCFTQCCLQAPIKANKMRRSHPFIFDCARSTSSMQNH